MDKLVVKELIQQDLTVVNLRRELDELLHNPQRIGQLKKDYEALKHLLSDAGPASLKAATAVYAMASP
jgi:lipid-A-disaccharide synthase